MTDQLAEAGKAMRNASANCHTVNGAVMLQAFAAWLEGRELFDVTEEIWQTADRLTSNVNGVEVKQCPDCGGTIVNIRETASLCSCSPLYATDIYEPAADLHTATVTLSAKVESTL